MDQLYKLFFSPLLSVKNYSTSNLLRPIHQINGYHSRQAKIAKSRPSATIKYSSTDKYVWGIVYICLPFIIRRKLVYILYCEAQARVRQGSARDGP